MYSTMEYQTAITREGVDRRGTDPDNCLLFSPGKGKRPMKDPNWVTWRDNKYGKI